MNFTKPELLDALRYADVVLHKDPDEIQSLFGDSLTIIDPLLKGKGDACYIIHEGDRAVVAFPGTKDLFQWALNFYKYHETDGGVNQGVKISMELMAEQIMDRLIELNPEKILITGMSRGGAMADAFVEFYAHLFKEIDCITFAQPMVFTQDYYDRTFSMKQARNVNYLRVCMSNDPVPDLPFKKYGYVHKGDSLRLGDELSLLEQIKLMWLAWRNHEEFMLAGVGEHDTGVILSHLRDIK